MPPKTHMLLIRAAQEAAMLLRFFPSKSGKGLDPEMFHTINVKVSSTFTQLLCSVLCAAGRRGLATLGQFDTLVSALADPNNPDEASDNGVVTPVPKDGSGISSRGSLSMLKIKNVCCIRLLCVCVCDSVCV